MVDNETAITESATGDRAVDVPDEPQRYFIEVGWFERNGLSFKIVAQGRFCASCRGKLGTEIQERLPTVDERTGRVVFETRSAAFGVNPASVIRNCCGAKREYITRETPVSEALFRAFLANGNQPVDVATLREQLAEWVAVDASSTYSEETLEAILRSRNHYGLTEFNLKPE